MAQMMDMRVTELLASRLCHDLVGPIGAVSNGIELMADDDFGMADDALKLAAQSASHASSILQFFRLAYGMAGNRQGEDLGSVRDLAQGFLAHGKSELAWPTDPQPESLPNGCGKILLNMIALAAEALPRGGNVAVSLTPAAAGMEIEVAAAGTDAGLRPEAAAAVTEDVAVEDLTPRTVHGYFTKTLARRGGGELKLVDEGAGQLRVVAILPL